MYTRFGLTLMVTHACSMRCTYCYAGRHVGGAMPEAVGRRAIERAMASLVHGGTLELGFFGGEPLLEAALIGRLIDHAQQCARASDVSVVLALTTNGTVTDLTAWALMQRSDLELSISFDGLPEVHDAHRRFMGGRGSAGTVLRTLSRMVDSGREFGVIAVVRPDNLVRLADGLRFMLGIGVRRVELALDLWADWTPADAPRLDVAISEAADVWRAGLPQVSINWFDEKAGRLAGCRMGPTARCGFGDGEIAVSPAGHLYPCERLIGDDEDGNPMRLSGRADQGDDFVHVHAAQPRRHTACDGCAAASLCSTTCRCSNYVRTGDVTTPDRLLCELNQVCLREVTRVLDGVFVGAI